MNSIEEVQGGDLVDCDQTPPKSSQTWVYTIFIQYHYKMKL